MCPSPSEAKVPGLAGPVQTLGCRQEVVQPDARRERAAQRVLENSGGETRQDQEPVEPAITQTIAAGEDAEVFAAAQQLARECKCASDRNADVLVRVWARRHHQPVPLWAEQHPFAIKSFDLQAEREHDAARGGFHLRREGAGWA